MLMTTPVCAEAVLKEREDLQMQYPQGGDIGYLLCAVEDGGWVPEARLSFAYWMFGPPISVLLGGAYFFAPIKARACAREGVADFLALRVFFRGFDLDLVPWLEKKIPTALGHRHSFRGK